MWVSKHLGTSPTQLMTEPHDSVSLLLKRVTKHGRRTTEQKHRRTIKTSSFARCCYFPAWKWSQLTFFFWLRDQSSVSLLEHIWTWCFSRTSEQRQTRSVGSWSSSPSGSSSLPDQGGIAWQIRGKGMCVWCCVYTPGKFPMCSVGCFSLTLVMAAEGMISPSCIRQLHWIMEQMWN